jgi:hypothetical protein
MMTTTTVSTADQDLWYRADEIGSFADRLVEEVDLYLGLEKRTAPRRSISVPVGVRALDDNLAPCGPMQNAITANISRNGIGFWHTTPLEARFVEVQMATATGAQIAAVAELRHTTRLGSWYISGAEFLFGTDR